MAANPAAQEIRLEDRGASRRDAWALAAVTAAAVGLRFLSISYRGSYLGWDEAMYLMLGRHLLEGQGYQLNGPPNITFPPLVPVIGGGVWLLTGSIRWALSAPSALLGGLAVIPVFLLARRMFSRTAAFAAAVVFAGLRPLLFFSAFCWYKLRLYDGSEQIFLFIAAWALYFFWRSWQDKSILFAALAGLACGVGFLARQEALALWGVLLAWLLVCALVLEKRLTLNLAGRIAAAAALFIAASSPFFVFAHSVTGHFTFGPHLSHNVVVRDAFRQVYFYDEWRPFLRLYLSLNADNTDYENTYYGVDPEHVKGLRREYSDAGLLKKLLVGTDPGAVKYWAKDMLLAFPWYLFAFAFVGLAGRPSREWLVKLLFLAAVAVPALAIAATLIVLPRYDVYLGGLLAVFAGAGLQKIGRFAARAASAASAKVAAVSSVVATAVALAGAAGIAAAGARQVFAFNRSPAAQVHRERHIERMTPRIAAELRRLGAAGSPVLCHDPQAVLYAGAVWLPLPMEDLDRIAAFARHRGARLMVLKSSDCAPSEESKPKAQRPFTFAEALARTGLAKTAFRGKIDGEEVSILEILRAGAADTAGAK